MQHILDALGSDHELIQTAIDIQQIAAPTFQEHQRADAVRQRFARPRIARRACKTNLAMSWRGVTANPTDRGSSYGSS